MDMQFILAVILTLALSGCEALTAASTVANLTKPAANGIDAELTIGTKEEQVNTEVVLGDKNKTVNQQATQITNRNVSMSMLLLLSILSAVGAIGWVLPSPGQLWRSWRNKKGA